MPVVDEIGNVLSTAGVASSSGVAGWFLALNWLPDSTGMMNQLTVAVIETAGLPPNPRCDFDTNGVQVLVRGQSIINTATAFADTRAKAEGVRTALHAVTFTSSSGRYYPGVLARQSPFLMHVDELKRPVYAINFLAWRSRT